MQYLIYLFFLISLFSCNNEKKIEQEISLDDAEVYESSKLEEDTFSNNVRGLGPEVLKFLSPSEIVIDTAMGDINQDGKKEFVLVSIPKVERSDTILPRRLIILSTDSLGYYYIAGQSYTCIGVSSDAERFIDLQIRNGIMTIEFSKGDTERTNRYIDFLYSKKEKTWIVVKDRIVHSNINTDKITEETQTAKDFGLIKLEDFRSEM